MKRSETAEVGGEGRRSAHISICFSSRPERIEPDEKLENVKYEYFKASFTVLAKSLKIPSKA